MTGWYEANVPCSGAAVNGLRRGSNWQDAYPRLRLVDGEKRASFQDLPVRLQGTDDQRAKMRGRHVLRADLQHARTAIFAVRQEDAEIEVVREDYAGMVARSPHDFGIRSVTSTHRRPVNRFKAVPT